MAKCKKLSWRYILWSIIAGVVLCTFVLPYVGGFLAYGTNFGGIAEQRWLDRVINHLQILRLDCNDPELNKVLKYIIRRYNRIGPFDVAVSRCDWYPFYGRDTLGINNPFVSGVTIDLNVPHRYSIHSGAMLLVHEALHDYPPYFSHNHIDPMINKLENLYVHSKTNRKRARLGSLKTDRI